jgi:hypothetical protein
MLKYAAVTGGTRLEAILIMYLKWIEKYAFLGASIVVDSPDVPAFNNISFFGNAFHISELLAIKLEFEHRIGGHRLSASCEQCVGG